METPEGADQPIIQYKIIIRLCKNRDIKEKILTAIGKSIIKIELVIVMHIQ